MPSELTNPVETVEARFGDATDDETIPLDRTLRFDFDSEGLIGGTFVHEFSLLLSLERHWEL
jgi:hypothetical protein